MFFRKHPKEPSLGEALRPASSRGPQAAVPSVSSALGRNTRFRGEVRGRGPLIVRGHLQGRVGLEDRLIIEPGGVVDADVRADDLVVGGVARGDVQARGTLALCSTGVVEGKMAARRFRVEEGARIDGTVAREEKEP